ncbi:YggT family protein [Trueperella pyogenes]|uniref:YggT family protein n=2 Tax=Trueperella pyogenes TaxID=1661 RepID=A0A2S0RJW7_9ACTO|nr:YggT family protein [Trueperella pyogenes]AWG04818.1 YggT family protein [Trueperella pyogenes]AWG15644.1 YggT family protein [Trueperella pyogenes]AZR00245.1 YggT family protein [Trueperella pyogenes]AZR03270.1 YggT family protein [Trueperella pyogenes]
MMTILGQLLFWACQIYILILIGRVVLDFVQILSRDWYPTGILVVIANAIYKVTDPPLRLLGKFIPPLNLGGVSLDLGFIVLFIAVQILQRIAYFL